MNEMINKIVEKFLAKLFELLLKKIEVVLKTDFDGDGKIG